jgi:hypothetical protein
MEDQRILHYFISTVGNFTPVAVAVPIVEEEVVVDPLANNYGQPENQTNLLVQIAEFTGDESLLTAQYPVTEEKAFQLPDNQVVQEEVEIEPIVHQFEEIILEVKEAEETPFDLDAEDDAVLDALLVPIEREISPENSTDIFPQDEEVVYTDAVGNTFKVPVPPCVGHDFESEEAFDLMSIVEEEEDNTPDFF